MDGEQVDRRLTATARQARCLELRRRGLSYREIARRCEYRGPSGAHKAVTSALSKTLRECSEDVRQLELERLDAMLAGLWDKATRGDVRSVSAVLRVMDRRAKLLGLDQPTRLAVTEAEDQTIVLTWADDAENVYDQS